MKEKVLITGMNGFIGKHLVDVFSKDYKVIDDYDNTDLINLEEVYYVIETHKPTYIIHAAGYNGSLDFNMKYPSDIFINNTIMGLNILKVASVRNVQKVVSFVTSCAYPNEERGGSMENIGIYSEHSFLKGVPFQGSMGHGYAKRNLQIGSWLINKQLGLNAVTMCPTTVYGPGDSLDLNKTKVMMGLIKKILTAKNNKEEVLIMRGTGEAKRQFIYVEDVANRTVDVLKYYVDTKEPINIATNENDISIKDLTMMICRICDYQGSIIWDGQNDGQYRKKLTTFKANRVLPKYKYISLEEGIKRTVEWTKTQL